MCCSIRKYASIKSNLECCLRYFALLLSEKNMAIPTDLDNAQTTAKQTHAKEGWFARIMRAFRYDPRWWCGVVLLVFVLAAIFAPLISPYSPILYHPSIAEQGPG